MNPKKRKVCVWTSINRYGDICGQKTSCGHTSILIKHKTREICQFCGLPIKEKGRSE